jgi:hypothetical protein
MVATAPSGVRQADTTTLVSRTTGATSESFGPVFFDTLLPAEGGDLRIDLLDRHLVETFTFSILLQGFEGLECGDSLRWCLDYHVPHGASEVARQSVEWESRSAI